MTDPNLPAADRRPGIWDIVLGIILVLLGILVLGNAVIATVVSVMMIAWVAIIGGIISIAGGVMTGRGGWALTGLISGALLIALGLVLLGNPIAGAFWLTLLLGAIFLARGITTLIAAFSLPAGRWLFIISGLIALALGLVVVLNLFSMTFVLLGILLGIELIVTGVTVALTNRPLGLRI